MITTLKMTAKLLQLELTTTNLYVLHKIIAYASD